MNKKYSGLYFPMCLLIGLIFTLSIKNTCAQDTDNGYKLKTVVIDAGHGGKDPGSLGKLTSEKEVVLAIALKTGKYIEENIPGVKVIYTRKTDTFVELHKRAEIANSNKADLFISIHANGNENHLVTGTESLVLGLHRAGENFEVAKKENSVILLEDDYSTKYEGFDLNSPESYQIFSLMQERYFDRSINFAGLVQEQFRERAARKDRSVKQQGLLVLARTAMPGILIETGFITNPDEEKYLMSDEGQDYIASAIYRAFRDYKNIIESKTSFAIASWTNKSVISDDSVTGSDELPKQDSSDNYSKPPPALVMLPAVEFKVQIAASSKPISTDADLFRGISGITEYHIGKIYKYVVGGAPTFQEIIEYSKQIKERFPDAFIIAVKEGEIIPLHQALKESQQITSKN
jgi:N-acetylmuramoyl-L-alanine amidase